MLFFSRAKYLRNIYTTYAIFFLFVLFFSAIRLLAPKASIALSVKAVSPRPCSINASRPCANEIPARLYLAAIAQNSAGSATKQK